MPRQWGRLVADMVCVWDLIHHIFVVSVPLARLMRSSHSFSQQLLQHNMKTMNVLHMHHPACRGHSQPYAGQVSGALAGVCHQMGHNDLSQGHFFTCFSFNFHLRVCQTVTKTPTLKPCLHPTGSIQLWAVLYSGQVLSVHHPLCGGIFPWDVQHYTRCFSLLG